MKVKKPIGKKFRAPGTTARKKSKGQKKINEYVLELETKIATLKKQLHAALDELPRLIEQQVDQELNTTNTFLKELVEQARKYGWDGDYVIVRGFVQYCFRKADKMPPTDTELEPYR